MTFFFPTFYPQNQLYPTQTSYSSSQDASKILLQQIRSETLYLLMPFKSQQKDSEKLIQTPIS